MPVFFFFLFLTILFSSLNILLYILIGKTCLFFIFIFYFYPSIAIDLLNIGLSLGRLSHSSPLPPPPITSIASIIIIIVTRLRRPDPRRPPLQPLRARQTPTLHPAPPLPFSFLPRPRLLHPVPSLAPPKGSRLLRRGEGPGLRRRKGARACHGQGHVRGGPWR